jgi:hypothetical protein
MVRISRIGMAVLVGVTAMAGCGKDPSPETAAENQSVRGANEITVNNPADPATNPVAGAAYDFLDAVLKGDTQRASSRLTPLALQRIVESGKQFAPPGLETATFRIGEVRTPSETQALVQCVLSDSSSGQPRNEEMCCLMRFVKNEWRVSGIAYSSGANRPPMILDFENPPQEAAAKSPMAGATGEQPPPAAVPSTGRPSPPRTAQETPASATYR